jgi:hypothetical protein
MIILFSPKKQREPKNILGCHDSAQYSMKTVFVNKNMGAQ